jgi:Zn-dependent metalloprotease
MREIKRVIAVSAIVLVGLLGVTPAAMAKRPPEDLGLEKGVDPVEPYVRQGDKRVSAVTGVPLALYRVNYPVAPGSAEAMARQYLRENAGSLRLRSDLSDLRLRSTRQTPVNRTVRFQQHYQGIPVQDAEIAVSLDNHARVTFVMNGYKPGVALARTTPAVSADRARELALAYLGARQGASWERTELVVHHRGTSRLAQRVELLPRGAPLGEWRVLVDAQTGEVFQARDLACYQQARRTPAVDGTATVFDPDPLSTAGAAYGDAGFVDGNDADTAQLTGQLLSRPLRDITFSGGVHSLVGPWAEIVDFEAPFTGLFTQPGSDFSSTRSPQLFEPANTYYAIDTYMRYMNTTLGVAVHPTAYPGGVKFDPHGLSGADNSHYLSGSEQLAFGEGGVDDDEDADVIIHELGHGIHDWVTDNGLSLVEGLSEGLGDYFAASYSRSFNQWPPGAPEFNWVFSWDGHNPFWPGRITNYGAHYPEDLTGQIHTDGQIISTSLMRIWDGIGREQTDRAVLVGLGMTNSGTNQEDAAQAMLQAAFDLGYTGAEQVLMFNEFTATGYDVTMVPVALMGFTVE